jgi:hypothetical protein
MRIPAGFCRGPSRDQRAPLLYEFRDHCDFLPMEVQCDGVRQDAPLLFRLSVPGNSTPHPVGLK